ncbi:MAG: molybdopterin-dependent oxidoreductase [Chloroflexi bacterium]|nr:molybdopterin-dependent oxidoreductase [Chloroflexota bacterium]MCL5074294.1 molybdopterin-dependent oxidoreductase [Chloroflexota bacterium]
MENFLLSLMVNGREYSLAVPVEATLLHVLREQLHLTGTKNGCGKGYCGACTVIMGGKAIKACRTLALKASGQEVVTIEGLGTNGQLDPLQEAFIEHSAVQCGYCTPGMIMAAKALLDAQPHPSEEQIRKALAGNLCRCTGYQRIVRAIQEAAETMTGHRPRSTTVELKTSTLVGASILRSDAKDKVTGRAIYAADLFFPNMLYGQALRAQLPHAEIIRIDTSKARAMAGVEAVLTAEDVPGENSFGIIFSDQPVLCRDRVRYMGDAVALVAAISPEVASRACQEIVVEYRELPAVFSAQEALAPDAPQIHAEGNIANRITIDKGDIERGFCMADVVIENTYDTPFAEHAFLEPEAGMAVPDNDGGVTVYVGSQDPFGDRRQVAQALGLSEEKVRIVHTVTGGAFGGKDDISLQIHVALLALKTGRPAKMVFSREESMIVHPKKHPFLMRYKTGATRDGLLTAVEAQIISDKGAYASLSLPTIRNAAVHAIGPYAVPNVRVEAIGVFTNNPPAGAMRGFGVPQVAFAHELQMDALAHKLGIDPLELRLKNALKVGSVTASGEVLQHSVGLTETIRRAAEELKKMPRESGIGVGVACAFKNVGFGHGRDEPAGAEIVLGEDGQLFVHIGASELGQGINTVLQQMVAQELGIALERVQVYSGDTAMAPSCGATTASRQTFIIGNATLLAAQQARMRLLGLAEHKLKVKKEELVFKNGHIVARADPQKSLSVNDVLTVAHEQGLQVLGSSRYYPPPTTPLSPETVRSETAVTYLSYGFATQIAIVRVDQNTGQVQVLAIIAAHDVGKAINPLLVKSQIEGGCTMGVGYALLEEMVIERGITKTLNFNKYRIPTFQMAPKVLPIIVEDEEPHGPFGAKGVGEISTVPTAAAIVNAIYDATGVRITSLPATPQKIRRALLDRQESVEEWGLGVPSSSRPAYPGQGGN